MVLQHVQVSLCLASPGRSLPLLNWVELLALTSWASPPTPTSTHTHNSKVTSPQTRLEIEDFLTAYSSQWCVQALIQLKEVCKPCLTLG
jgi:hypothetical protein